MFSISYKYFPSIAVVECFYIFIYRWAFFCNK